MAFVNEYISAEDEKKYGLEEIDKRFRFNGVHARDWTIDRDRSIYLRIVARGGGSDPDLRSQSKWTFCWKGHLLVLELDALDGSGEPGMPGWSLWRLDGISIPDELAPQQSQIISDLKEALTAYRGGGVFSANYSSYDVTLDIAEGVL